MERGFFYSQKDKLNYIHFSRSQFILWNSLKTQYFHIYKRGILIESIIHLAKQLLIYCYFFHGQLRNISFNIFSGLGRVMRVKPGEKYVTGSCFNKTSKKNIMIFYTKLKPIRTGWSWSSGSEDLEIGVSLRGPVLDFSREIKMPSFEVPEHILSSSD